jgi:hypothetical protein
MIVKHFISWPILTLIDVLIDHFQCNKKQSGAGVRSLPEADVANREVPASSPTLQQQVLLSACLSCEGCVSEEESLKISQQNLEEVARVLGQNKVLLDH